MVEHLPLNALQPTQLYVSSQKLARLRAARQAGAEPPPVPIARLLGTLIYTDGHTRALAAHLAGLTSIPVVYDDDPLDMRAYSVCVGWCRAQQIWTVADLAGRVLEPLDYQRLWLDRCRLLRRQLGATDHGRDSARAGETRGEMGRARPGRQIHPGGSERT